MSELEEQYILRVPEHIAEQLRAMIRNRAEPAGGVKFALNRTNAGVREGVFECGGESLRCSLLDLPHNVETYTSSDRVNYYKSADLGQMILVHPAGGQALTPTYKPDTFQSLDGLTPPMRRALYRFQRKSTGMTARTLAVAESELLAMLKGDNEVIEELDEKGLTLQEAAEAAEQAAEAARKAAAAAAAAAPTFVTTLAPSITSTAATSDADVFKRPATPPPPSKAKQPVTSKSTTTTTIATEATPYKAHHSVMALSASTTATATTTSSSPYVVPATPATPATPETPAVAHLLRFAPPTESANRVAQVLSFNNANETADETQSSTTNTTSTTSSTLGRRSAVAADDRSPKRARTETTTTNRNDDNDIDDDDDDDDSSSSSDTSSDDIAESQAQQQQYELRRREQEQRIDECRQRLASAATLLASEQNAVAAAPNAIIRNRIMDRLNAAQAKRDEVQRELETLINNQQQN